MEYGEITENTFPLRNAASGATPAYTNASKRRMLHCQSAKKQRLTIWAIAEDPDMSRKLDGSSNVGRSRGGFASVLPHRVSFALHPAETTGHPVSNSWAVRGRNKYICGCTSNDLLLHA